MIFSLFISKIYALFYTFKHLNKLNAAEIDIWRKSARRSSLEKNMNTKIRRIMGVEETVMENIIMKVL